MPFTTGSGRTPSGGRQNRSSDPGTAPEPRAAPEPRTAPLVRGHLTHPLTEMIGRAGGAAGCDRKASAIAAGDADGARRHRQDQTRSGSCGPGRLREFADGAWLVPLGSACGRETGRGRRSRQELGLKEEPGQPVLESLVRHLQPKKLLLLLDNCEHLLSCVYLRGLTSAARM